MSISCLCNIDDVAVEANSKGRKTITEREGKKIHFVDQIEDTPDLLLISFTLKVREGNSAVTRVFLGIPVHVPTVYLGGPEAENFEF